MQVPMKSKFDTKSLIAGSLVGAAVVLCIAASTKGPGSVGRFQTVINDNGSLVMTDTTTGQAWNTDLVGPANMRDQEFKKPKLE
jgi:hypothetical protein